MNDDRESAQRLVHSLKGVSGNLGAMALYTVSSDIEHLMKQGIEVSETLIVELSNELERTVEFAQQVLNREKIR
ncbi:Hpt domain-containing protein [Vibrio alfacsensis]|uniref:Hpt domain-containing protein n=1 Tax=Vibrio alfacsensis TaxID=1074311 RepID=UPI004067613C